jgi:hypothetical protein
VQANRPDYRPIGLGIAAIAVLLAGIAVVFRPRTPFELEHARAEAGNPKWLRVEITTADNRREHRENEPIYIVPRFSSTVRYKYKIEIAEGKSESAVDFLHISNGHVVPRNLVGIFCCFSRLVGLDDEPYSPRTVTPLRLPPGQYEIYLTTRRVFAWEVGPEEYTPGSFELASNLLRIRVVAERK